MIFNHRFPGVTTGLTFKVFDLWSITISSKPNAFHGLRLDIVASNTSVAESFLKPSPSLRLLPSDLNFRFVTNFPCKGSWWDTLPSLTEVLKEGWKEMFLTTWKGLHNFFLLMLTYVPHHFFFLVSLTRSLLASCNALRHYLLNELVARLVQWWEHSLPINFAPVEIPVSTPYVIVFVVGSFLCPERFFSSCYGFPIQIPI